MITRVHRLSVVALCCALGCAKIEPRTPDVHDTPIATDAAEVALPGSVQGSVVQEGTRVTVLATGSCNVVERDTVLRTTSIEYENHSAALDWLAGGSGIGLLAIGVVTLADAPKVSGNDTSTRTYNPIGPGGATALGVASIVAGAALLAIPIVDVVRAQRSSVTQAKVVQPDRVLHRDVPCSNAPLGGAPVTGTLFNSPVSLGVTDANGKLVADLATTIETGEADSTLEISIGKRVLGVASLRAVFESREMRAWQGLSAPPCVEATSPAACEPFNQYLTKFPRGAHALEARRILAEAGPKLAAAAEEDAWRPAKSSVDGCTTTKVTKPEEIDALCAPIKTYLERFAAGAHAKEAEAALVKADARKNAMAGEAARRERAQQAAAQSRAASDRANRVAACKGSCAEGCGSSANFLGCMKNCEARCGN